LGLPLLSHDESFSWRLTTYPVGELCARTATDVHPPLYYLLLQTWVAVWGDSTTALRALSVLLGLAAVGLLYLAVWEAARWSGASPAMARGGALLSALLMAVNAEQVLAARTARMYALGTMLAALTAWLLLKALRGQRHWGWWTAYGLALAAFCLTHNYAGFTALAQAGIVVGVVLRRLWARQPAGSLASGYGYAGFLAVVLYSPWLPAFLEQTRQVQQGFWIGPITSDLLQRTFFSWSSGMEAPPAGTILWWLLLLSAVVVATAWRSGPGGWFCLVQAAAPWIGGILFSLLAARPIVLERCLVFGQLAWLGYWGVAWSQLRSCPAQVLLAVFLLSAQGYGLVQALAAVPDQQPAITEAAAFLAGHAKADETIWVASPWEVNQLRYYLTQAGAEHLKVRCPYSPFAKGHMIHIAALTAEDVALAPAASAPPAGRFWIAGATAQRALALRGRLLASYAFGKRGDSFTLDRYSNEKNP
jgi:mannosyltransferase